MVFINVLLMLTNHTNSHFVFDRSTCSSLRTSLTSACAEWREPTSRTAVGQYDRYLGSHVAELPSSTRDLPIRQEVVQADNPTFGASEFPWLPYAGEAPAYRLTWAGISNHCSVPVSEVQS